MLGSCSICEKLLWFIQLFGCTLIANLGSIFGMKPAACVKSELQLWQLCQATSVSYYSSTTRIFEINLYIEDNF